MDYPSLFVPKVLWIFLPGAPEEFKAMKPRRMDNGDIFDAELQITENRENPLYIGDITDCFYDRLPDHPKLLELYVDISTDLLYGRWVMTDLSISPAADTTTEREGIIRPSYWKLNGVSLNLADETKKKGAVPVEIHIPVHFSV